MSLALLFLKLDTLNLTSTNLAYTTNLASYTAYDKWYGKFDLSLRIGLVCELFRAVVLWYYPCGSNAHALIRETQRQHSSNCKVSNTKQKKKQSSNKLIPWLPSTPTSPPFFSFSFLLFSHPTTTTSLQLLILKWVCSLFLFLFSLNHVATFFFYFFLFYFFYE